jgi:hypothetical protein
VTPVRILGRIFLLVYVYYSTEQEGMACVYIPDRLLGFIKILVIKFFFSCVLSVVVLVFSRQIIIDNWRKYKCNPLITPFAEVFGHDSQATMNECSHEVFKQHSVHMVGPLTGLFDNMGGAMHSLGSIMGDLTMSSSSLASVFGTGISGFMTQLTNVGSTIQYMIIKIQTLLQRLMATVLVIVYTMNSLVQGILGIQKDAAFKDIVNFLTSF